MDVDNVFDAAIRFDMETKTQRVLYVFKENTAEAILSLFGNSKAFLQKVDVVEVFT